MSEHQQIFLGDGVTLSAEGPVEAGVKDGVWTWYNTGTGAPRQVVRYVRGRKDGEERLYGWTSGRHVATHTWRADQRHGPFSEFGEDGALLREGQYEDGQLEGVLRALDDKGDQLLHLIAKADSPRIQLYRLLDAFRPDDAPEDWMVLADRLAENTSNSSDADRLACAAMLRAHAHSQEVPESWLRHFRFTGYEYGYGSGYGEMFAGVEQVAAVLALFPRPRVRRLIVESLTATYPTDYSAPFLADHLDDALWGLLTGYVSGRVLQYDLVLSHWLLLGRSLGRAAGHEEPIRSDGLKKPAEREALRGDGPRGLTIQDRHEPTSPPEGEPRTRRSAGNTSRQARVGEALLERLTATAAQATDRRLTDLWRWCGLHVLLGWLKRGGTPDTRWDELIDFKLVSHKDDYDFYHYVGPLLAEALSLLPGERAEALWLAALDPGARYAARPLMALASVPTPAVLSAAGEFLAQHQDDLRMPYQNHVVNGLRALSPALAEAVLRAALGQGVALSTSAGWFRDGMGRDRVDEIIAASGLNAREPSPADRLRRLADRCFAAQPTASREQIYLLSPTDEAPTGLGRVGGLPPGLPERGWPRRKGQGPMTHLFTLDLAALPGLAELTGGAVALSLYVEDPADNEAFSAYNDRTAVVLLSRADLDRGEPDPATLPDLDNREAQGLIIETVEVPLAAFAPDPDGDSDEAAALRELHGAIYRAHARAGGEPIWLQDEEASGTFLLQFDEGFVDINLGDAGVMYVFRDTAFWQCH